jgi:uncharacterized protein YjbJ (UPF0337 family)
LAAANAPGACPDIPVRRAPAVRRVLLRLVARGVLPGGYSADMSNEDKMSNKIDELAGKGKETAGRATDNPDLEAEGKGDQSKSNLKQAGEKVKDVFK